MATVPIQVPAPMHPEARGSTDQTAADSPVAQDKVTSDTSQLTVHIPFHARRGVALGIVAALALVFALQWAEGFVISLVVGIFLAYTLNPLVVWLEWIKVPRIVGAAIVMLAVVCALGLGTYSLRGQMQAIVDQLPEAASKLSVRLASLRLGQFIDMQKVQTAAREIEKAAGPAESGAPARQRATHVVVDQPGFKLGNVLWMGSMGALGFIGEAAMVAFLVFFLLLSGDTFKRKLVLLTGPSLAKKKITVQILDDINASIQRYMFMLFVTNLLVALLCWIAFRWIGLENAGAWAVAAGLLHIIPYFGPAVTAGATGLAAFLQFDSLWMVLLVSGASLTIATVVGIFVTTWMSGRIAKMNAAAVFIALLFWSWLWGVWGMLLGIPIIFIVKVISQHVEQLHPVAELLGE